MNNFSKNLALWVIIGLLLIALVNLFQGSQPRSPQTSLAYSDFLADVQSGRVSDVTIQGNTITGRFGDGRPFQTYAPQDPRLVDRLADAGVRINVVPVDKDMPSLLGVLVSWFPMLLLIGVWIFFMRQMQSGGGRAMGFGKSRARLLTEKHGRVTFEDVAGVDEAKEELQEIVEYLKNPQKFQQVGGRIPKGCLLVGPPGTGKTLLARAIAGEANVPFFTISGSDFVEMDGFEANEGVILIAATNRPDVLDPALLRPGRFDRQIVVPYPDIVGREKILRVHLKKVRTGPDVDPKIIARGTPGFSGADLANLVNEAALLAARRSKRIVTMAELEAAKDRVMMGAERRSMVMSEEEKRLTAYHEAGHAVVAWCTPASDPIHKATIIPRGRALGMVMRLPESDRISVSREKLEADIAVAMGGRVAEELIFGREKVTAGAASDIEQATKIARHMVTQWGMSDELGPVGYAENTQEVFLGHAITQSKNISEATAQQIDREIRNFVERGYARAREILQTHMDQLHALARALLEFETLTGDEIDRIMRGLPVERPERPEEPPAAAATAGSEGKRSSVPPTARPVEDEGGGGMAPQPGT